MRPVPASFSVAPLPTSVVRFRMDSPVSPASFLVVRRDNIGDLVCTTPLISAMRQRYPQAWIGALVNSYNAPVLSGNPDVDQVFSYTKLKHRALEQSWLDSVVERLGMILTLRRRKIHTVILAAPGSQASAERFARWVAPHRILRADPDQGGHEVERIMSCLSSCVEALPVTFPCRVVPEPQQIQRLTTALPPALDNGAGPLVALHISARKPSQRWPASRFAELARQLHDRWQARFLLFWSPGATDDPRHPGDDDKAAEVLALTRDLPIHPIPTSHLEELIAGLSLADRVVCSDGGAMHLAAGLGKPMVCFFGKSSAERWHPWGVSYQLLQPDSLDVGDVGVNAAVAAFTRLMDDSLA